MGRKKIGVFLIGICLLFGMVFLSGNLNFLNYNTVSADTTYFEGGIGTEADPYQIANATQLTNLSTLVNETSTNAEYKNLSYILTADIDLSGQNWLPIGASTLFSGKFDGNNHTISNLTIPAYVEGLDHYGLFGRVVGTSSSNLAVIKNLEISNVTINAQPPTLISYFYVAGVVAYAQSASVSNCFTSNLNLSSNFGHVGGIVGRVSENTTISNCINTSNINISANNYLYIGGIAGLITDATISGCVNIGDISASNNLGQTYAGGISGYTGGRNISSPITNCYNIGNISAIAVKEVATSNDTRAGGISSHLYKSTVLNCYNTGNINASDNMDYCYSAGIAAYLDVSFYPVTISYCYNVGSISVGNELRFRIGGIIAHCNQRNGIINYCYALLGKGYSALYYESSSWINPANVTGGLATENAMKTLPTYQHWDFFGETANGIQETWSISSNVNNGYPTLNNFNALSDHRILIYNYNLSGETNNNVIYDYDTIITLEIPTREGYVFVGWNDGTTFYLPNSTFVMPNYNIVLTAVWIVSGEQTGASDSSGGWRVASVIKNEDNTYKNKINVTYENIKVGSKLFARVTKNGVMQSLSTISSTISSRTTCGELNFYITTETISEIYGYDIEIYSAEGYTLYNCGVVQVNTLGERVTNSLETVYFDPAGLFGGNDLNSGATTYAPVATLEMAKTLAKRDGTIVFISTFEITQRTTLDFNDYKATNISSCTTVFNISNGANLTVNKLNFTSTVGYLLFNINENSSLTLNNCNINTAQRIVMLYPHSTLIINESEFTGTDSAPISFHNANDKSDSITITVTGSTFEDFTCGAKGSIFAPYNLILDNHNVSYVDITLNNCSFMYNNGYLGSVVHLNAGSLTVNGGKFVGNTATVGGVFYINALNGATCPVNIQNATFSDNATNGYYVLSSAEYDIKHSGSGANTDSKNNLSGGGVIFCSQPLTIGSCYFDGNSANGTVAYAGGGAILIGGDDASLDITNSRFFDNRSAKYGGALFVSSKIGVKYVKITNCNFNNNTSNADGGAIWFDNFAVQEKYEIKASTFTSNSSITANGGAFSLMKGSFLAITDCDFFENSATLGGAMYVMGTIMYANCSFFSNLSSTGESIYRGQISEPINDFPEEILGNWQDFKATDFAGGTGTSADPYQIATAEQLAYLAYMVNTGSNWSSGKHFIQTANIDLSAHFFTQIGTYVANSGDYTKSFRGVFDGNEFKIGGLYINSTEDYVGLFGMAYGSGCVIQNVTVLSGKIHSTGVNGRIGGIVGDNSTSSTVTNCTNSGTVSGTSYIGGIVGQNYSSFTVTNCSNSGTISGTSYIGGIVGSNTTNSTVSNCTNSGTISGTNYIGGIAGRSETSSTVTNCSNSGTVSGTSERVGGIVGYNITSSTVTNCSNSGTVSGTNERVGGIVGFNLSSSTVINCTNSGTISGTSYIGGIVGLNGTENNLESEACFVYNCFNIGVVSGSSNVGGLVGQNRGFSIVQNCYWLFDSANSLGMAAGIGSTITSATDSDCTYFNNSQTLSANITINGTSCSTLLTVLNAWVVTNQTTPASFSLWTNDGTNSYPKLVDLLGGETGGTPAPTFDFPQSTTGNWLDYKATAFAGGTGTNVDPYQIATAEQLAYLAQMVNTGSNWSSGKYFIQTADIDLSAHFFTPIGTFVSGSTDYSKCFKGQYNGNGKVINGLYIFSNVDCAGLFGVAYGSDCVIENLEIASGKIQSSGNYVGGIVGYSFSYATIKECFNGSVVVGKNYVGGIVGLNNANSTVISCFNGGIISGANYIGGIVGQNYSYSIVSDCYNDGAVSGTLYVGGLCGHSSQSSKVTDSFSSQSGSLKLSILSLATPVLNLTLNKTTFTAGEDVTSLISGYIIKDSNGNIASGTFKMISQTISYSTTQISVRFYPRDAEKFNAFYFTLTVNVKFSASAIYYAKVSGVSNFYLDAVPTGASTIIAISLQQAVDFISGDGKIYFSTPFIVSSSMTLLATNRNITFMRNFVGEMFNITSTGTLQIGTKTMGGSFILDGNNQLSGELALIMNAGTLKIYGQVVIQNAYNVNGLTGQGGAIYNTGTADLDFMSITNCRSFNQSSLGYGGAIYNAGTMNIANLSISLCLSTQGGAIYNTGTLNMTNCNFDGNKGWYFSSAVYGCSIYTGGENSTLKLTNCKISNSYAVTYDGTTAVGATINVYGGGIYVGTNSQSEIYSSIISGSQAKNGGGLFISADGYLLANGIVIQKCISYTNATGSAIYTENANNVTLSNFALVGNASSSGTVNAGTDGLIGTTGSFTLMGENLSYEVELSNSNESNKMSINFEQLFEVLGILAIILVVVIFGTKSSKNRKKQ